jgi:hypothetical protein
LSGASQNSFDDVVLDGDLDGLCGARWELPTSLNRLEFAQGRCPAQERCSQEVGRSDRVLNGQVDSNAAYWGHRVSGVANAQKTRPRPLREPVNLHSQQADVFPIAQFMKSAAQEGFKAANLFPEGVNAPLPYHIGLTFGNNISGLPVRLSVK